MHVDFRCQARYCILRGKVLTPEEVGDAFSWYIRFGTAGCAAARKCGARLICATDPDCNSVGVMVGHRRQVRGAQREPARCIADRLPGADSRCIPQRHGHNDHRIRYARGAGCFPDQVSSINIFRKSVGDITKCSTGKCLIFPVTRIAPLVFAVS